MASIVFPPVDQADEDGLLAIGGKLTAESLLNAYQSGIFPWPISEDYPITWFAPPERAVLFLKDFHVSKSLRKELNKEHYEYKINENFAEVIKSCALPRVSMADTPPGTWITKEMVEAYTKLHRKGYCHSVECYYRGELCGGLYGVAIGRMFAGESMFYRRKNGSKLCFCYLVEHLRGKNVEWIDCQIMSPFLQSLGATTIARDYFMRLLRVAVREEVQCF